MLLEVLGEGGMGTVYRADQTEPVKRQVALKLIKTGMDSRAVLSRFDTERQALAVMDHPNIARVYDGGTTVTGQPFFVMELVKGEPISAYCDRRRLSVVARLQLFVHVCQAVQHAHLKGIIHRDLKPGNVLVTEVDGRATPKVIDFGVAKATEVKLTDQSLADSGAIVGTPVYMSPEQADPSSMDIDTRADIFSLGVILYELLAGSPPIDANQFHRGAILEMLRIVREVDPPKPSSKVSKAQALPSIAANRGIEPGHLKRALQGDLDWIAMKALEKDRARRYETANGLAADVLRHMAHEPVLAAPPSRAYRLRKFVRKHRVGVIAASLVVLALLGGTAGTTWGLIRAERARSAEAERVTERDAAVKTANARADELKHQLGVSSFLLASAAYDRGGMQLTAERLGNVPPDERGWEWRYLKRLSCGGLFTLYGHTHFVDSASFSPDGTRIVTGSFDQTAKVWDAQTGILLLDLKGHTRPVTSVSYSPDGTRIVTGSWDRTAKVSDARTGLPLLDLKGHAREVSCVSFSPDGTRIVTASWDQTAKVWDARIGSPLLDLKGHTGRVQSVSFSPDGTRIVTGSLDQTAKVWDAQMGTLLLDLKGHAGGVNSVSFSPDGTTIITGSQDQKVKIWDARTGTHLLDLKGETGGVNGVSYSPDGSRIVTGTLDQTAKVWDARTGTHLLDLKGHTSGVTSVSYSPDGMWIVTGSFDQTAKVWDARTETPQLELKGHASAVWRVSFSPDGARIVTGSADRTAKVWDARTGTHLFDLNGNAGRVWSVSFSPDGTRIVTGSDDRTAKVWDARTGSRLFKLEGHTGAVTSVAFSPDGTRIVTGGDQRAKVWDARTGAPLFDLKGHGGSVTRVSYSPDGTRIVTGSDYETAKVWDARTGSSLLDLKGHTSMVSSVVFSPDSTRIATGGPDMLAKVWDARTGTPLLDLKGHTGSVSSVSFSPDGKRIVTGGSDRIAKVWDARTGTPLLDLKGHTGWVNGVAFSLDGTTIITGGQDQTAKVWDAGAGSVPVELKGHSGTVETVSYSPDGTRIVTGSWDRTAKVWDARTGTLLVDLKGHMGRVTSVSFSPDGTQVVTGSNNPLSPGIPMSPQEVKVWDARAGTLLLDLKCTGFLPRASLWFSLDSTRIVAGATDRVHVWDTCTGRELQDEPIPPTAPTNQVSSDGRWIAHPAGDRVELIQLQPEPGERAHRRLLTQPSPKRYREGYEAAIKAKDNFAARFYLNLLPPPERAILRARPIVEALFDRLLLREDVLDAVRAQPAGDSEIQAACLKLAGTWSESAERCNAAGWELVCYPGRAEANYQRGLRLAMAACQLEPEDGPSLNTLGVAQYRCGLWAEALATLNRSNELNMEKEPSDLAFLALAQQRLGQFEKARSTLSRLRELMKDPQRAGNAEAKAFLHEAETIELDRVFPADPFAR
jgi:WD40 repeat protein/tRNA A-37 threonylcarbamoyl transferase component Bud32